MRIRFWGTRGSIAAAGPETLRYGGNTPCVEARTDDGTLLIFDCGTGARKLGIALAERGPIRAHLFLSHTHADHIQGLPFFLPAFLPGSDLTIYGPAGIGRSLPSAIGGQMEYAYFPLPIEALPARVSFVELGEGTFALGELRVRTRFLNHTAPCLAYRVDVGGSSLVYATDHEPHAEPAWRPGRRAGSFETSDLVHDGDRQHVEFLRGADVVVHDAQYVADEYAQKVTWGHSSVEYAVDVSRAAGVKRLVLFHHDPTRDDAAVDGLLRLAWERAGPVTVTAAAENDELTIEEVDHEQPAEHGPRAPRLPTRARVLVAEDERDVLDTLQQILSGDGYDVVTARDGEAVLQIAREQEFDLVLLDVGMPLVDGFEACRILRADERYATVPIVMLTARSGERDVLSAFGEGVTDYMTKPFSVAQLRARVRSWIVRGTAAAEG